MMKQNADVVFFNGAVWTADPKHPRAQAVAVRDGRIMMVGSDEQIKDLAGPGTRKIILNGETVCPGFIDCHVHFVEGGFSLSGVDLRTVKDRKGFQEKIKNKAEELEPGTWILNGNWNHQCFLPVELPRKEWIDGVSPNNPVFVTRHDLHMALANGPALQAAGINRETPSPEGGEIEKDPHTGEPTGILKDAAMELVFKLVPARSVKERKKAVKRASKYALSQGVTSVHDMGMPEDFRAYQELERIGDLSIRVTMYYPITEIDAFSRLRLAGPFGEAFLKIGGLKGFVDGSLGSGTALFFQPYADNPDSRGLLHKHMCPQKEMEEKIAEADHLGVQLALHAIGDRANSIVCDMFEKVYRRNGRKNRRWRVEHAQHLQPREMERIAGLELVASVQPFHLSDDGNWAAAKLGPERCRQAYPFRSLLDQGVVLVCGSDWPVVPLEPLKGIFTAVTRKTSDGKNRGGWIPEQKISLEDAFLGYTRRAAYAEFSEAKKGVLAEGLPADIVVLSRDVFSQAPEDLDKTEVVLTVFNGEVVYSKEAF
ncbi:MAG: amidohydrolase [Candidatus Aminicenantes bacterium]|nr:amidohydrolase [Candidatus Aminicenantes bacterium]